MAGKNIVRRSQRVAFMNTGTAEAPVYTRMTGFTSLSYSKNSKEYTRHYVDEESERSDVVGYAPSIAYSFDRHTNDAVHEKIARIHDEELLGNDAHLEILTVDLFTKDEAGKCVAIKRTYAAIPDKDGDGTDALVVSGTCKSVSEITKAFATVEEDGATATIVTE